MRLLSNDVGLVMPTIRIVRKEAKLIGNDGDDVMPSEFECEITGARMSDPVRLPSGNVVDRRIIQHVLLDKSENPFTREELIRFARLCVHRA